MAARAAPGGASTVALGTATPGESCCQRREDCMANPATMDAAAGGNTSIRLGGDGPAGSRGPVGGATSIILGSEGPEGMFNRREEQSRAGINVPEPGRRFPQNPGGDASICLGAAESPGTSKADVVRTRGPVGGVTTVILGTDRALECLRPRDQGQADVPVAAPRFQQAPGGTSAICLGGESAGDPSPQGVCDVRGPVGGAVSLTLGSDSSSDIFAQRRQEKEAAMNTPAPAPRFQQAPGGTASISIGGDADAGRPLSSRLPAGGRATLVLGSGETTGVSSEYREMHGASVDAPEAAPRFSQCPGGSSSLCLGPSAAAAQEAVPVRGPVGGATSICLGGVSASFPQTDEEVAARGPVGGPASLVLGTDDAKGYFEARQEQRAAVVSTPSAAPRFQQAPGGTSTLGLASDGAGGAEAPELRAPRGAVGGTATIVLGSDDYKEALGQRQMQRGALVETPDAAPRFSQAPGGNESACWSRRHADMEAADMVSGMRGPVGGASSILLGSDDSAAILRLHQEKRDASLETPDAAPRFHQCPGGTSSLSLADAGAPDAAPCTRGPVGGEATIVLGWGGSEALRSREAEWAVSVETPGPAPRFQQAPGGDTSICLTSKDAGDVPADQHIAVRGEVGGADTIVLGIDDSKAMLTQHTEQHRVVIDTPAAPPRFTQASGGTSSIMLAGGTPETLGPRCAPGGIATLVLGGDYPDDVLAKRQSANAFAKGSDQNCGNILTERPTTRLHQAPGGTATISLGSIDNDRKPSEKPSANQFARGSSQNSGNVLTDRSTTRLHQAPGGASTLCLGGGYPEEAVARPRSRAAAKSSGESACVGPDQAAARLRPDLGATLSILGAPGAAEGRPSDNCFASGASPNCGNGIPDWPTTRVHQAPGGDSSLCLGSSPEDLCSKRAADEAGERGLTCCESAGDENLDTSNVATVQSGKDVVEPQLVGATACDGAGGGVLG